ncbi:MAG: DNA-directed RNA polymerase subunit D [Conexivisphaerales archaeon]
MAAKLLESQGGSLSIRIDEYDLNYANAIRRYIISEVPTLAIEDVVVIENSSLIYDEIIAHRLGLVPLKTPKKYLEQAGAQLMLVLDAKAEGGTRTVYSGELVSVEDKEVYPVSTEIPLLKLAKGQSIKIEAYARLGSGKKHSKFSPISKATVKPSPLVNVINDSTDKMKEIVDSCPRSVFYVKEGKLAVADEDACTFCMECVKVDAGSVEIKEKYNSYILSIESIGQHEARDALMMGINLIQRDLGELAEKVMAL